MDVWPGRPTSTTVTQANQDTVGAGSWDARRSRDAPNDEKCTCLSEERLSAHVFQARAAEALQLHHKSPHRPPWMRGVQIISKYWRLEMLLV